MPEIKLIQEDFLTEGGCNACGPVNCQVIQLVIDEKERSSVESMDVYPLVMGIVQTYGWKQSYDFDDIDDVVLFSKSNKKIRVTDTYSGQTYEKENKKITVPVTRKDTAQVLEAVKDILETLFEISDVSFVQEKVE